MRELKSFSAWYAAWRTEREELKAKGVPLENRKDVFASRLHRRIQDECEYERWTDREYYLSGGHHA